MSEFLLRLSSKGQVTIPAEVRRHLGIEKNQQLAIVIEPEGAVRLEVPRYPDVEAVRGAVGALGKKTTWNDMLSIAREDRGRGKLKKKHG